MNINGDAGARAAGYKDYSDYQNRAAQGNLINSGASNNPITDQLNEAADKYIKSMQDQYGNQKDLMLKQLDAQHQLALGNNDTQTAKFLESVANTMEQQQGRTPYDYERYTNRELQNYALGNQGIQQGRSLALQKLANDEQNSQAQNTYGQQQASQQNAEDLNSRGLINGQTYQGAGGIAGVSRGITQQPFEQQRNYLNTSYNTNVGGVNQDYGLQQQNLDFTHANTMQDVTTDARRSAQDQQNTYQFGTQGANLNYQQQMNALMRQQGQIKTQNTVTGNTLYGQQQGVFK